MQIKKLNLLLNQHKFDGLFVSNFFNIFYLTGFKSLTTSEREAWVLVTEKNTYLFSDGRYFGKSQKSKVKSQKHKLRLKIKVITPEKGLISHLWDIVKKEKIKALGFEEEDLRVNELRELKEKISQINFIPTGKLVIKLREIKEKQEIQKIKRACLIADKCLKEIVKLIKLGQTEKEIAFKIEFWLRAHASHTAFPPIVAIDENSAIPHYDTASNGLGRVNKRSQILIDLGASYENYLSDMTRIIFFGKPTNEQTNIYNKLLSVQQKTINQCNNETILKNIDYFCRQQLTSSQLPATSRYSYPHSTGHGVGLEIHEYPKISQKSNDRLKPNQTFTIEPGIYLQGKWGMRIEDTIYIGKNLQHSSLTNFPKSLLII